MEKFCRLLSKSVSQSYKGKKIIMEKMDVVEVHLGGVFRKPSRFTANLIERIMPRRTAEQ